MELLRKYGVQCDVYFPLVKAGAQDFATSSDYTHASGDVKISQDGGAAANAANAPSAITMGNGAMWKLTLTATEMEAALIMVTIIDAATKAVEDQAILISTYGNASAQHALDLDTTVPTVAEIAEAVLDTALSEPTGVFAWASVTLGTAVAWMAALSRNKLTQDSSETVMRNDADDADIASAPISESMGTFTRGEWS